MKPASAKEIKEYFKEYMNAMRLICTKDKEMTQLVKNYIKGIN